MAILKFSIQAGCLVRGQIRSAIQLYCYKTNINCEVIEDKAWLGSVYYFKLDGTYKQILQAQKDLRKWFKNIDND